MLLYSNIFTSVSTRLDQLAFAYWCHVHALSHHIEIFNHCTANGLHKFFFGKHLQPSPPIDSYSLTNYSWRS